MTEIIIVVQYVAILRVPAILTRSLTHRELDIVPEVCLGRVVAG